MGFYNIAQLHNVDHLYKSACYSEANWLRGTECKFYPCINYGRDLESDFHAQLGEPVIVNVALEDYSQAELEKMNWIAESDDLPYQAFISNIIWPKFLEFRRECTASGQSFKEVFNSCFNEKDELIKDQPWYVRVSKFAILEFPYVMEVAGTQKFRVMKTMGDQTNPFIWKCQIVPHRDQVDLIPETTFIADTVTNYNPNNQVVGKAFTKQKNVHEMPSEKYPPASEIPPIQIPDNLDSSMGVETEPPEPEPSNPLPAPPGNKVPEKDYQIEPAKLDNPYDSLYNT